MEKRKLERYKKLFLRHFGQYILIAYLEGHNNLIAYTTPYLDFYEVAMKICEEVPATIDFNEQLTISIYAFGSNDCFRITVN